ncbi:MAG TPA: glycoside hydrolase family 5 protein [Steroidobacteraceae bacterium]|nr:glycoside hydrolase family 5 protein [Steroidobacteraceae bacterium]
MKEIDAWVAAKLMGTGFNIGNTLENTTTWETGWGNPRISKKYVDSLAALGFKTIRLPVAWDTYARNGVIQPDKFARVSEVVDWITAAGMFCVINIHWDGGWIDSSNKERFADTFATFSKDAERKYLSYWNQIATHFAGSNERVIFEALNEETNFEKVGSTRDAYATLTRVNQLFIDTVRKTGGNNAKRLLIVPGYATDITKTTSRDYVLPVDTIAHRLMISVHYYTPWQFAGMTEDASWGKMQPSWGRAGDVAELNRLFDAMQEFCKRNDLPAFIGEFGVTDKRETASRVRWMSAVAEAARSRNIVPVLWDTGGDVSRHPPHAPSPALREALLAPMQPRAKEASRKEVARELGAVLAWRLGPESVEESCKARDPDGAEVRAKALKGWLDKNARLIEAVDARVAEVVPLAFAAPNNVDAIQAVHAQVKEIVLESMFAQKSTDESKAICKAEADPANPRWNNSGMPHIQQSLAALYDWKMMQGAK